MRRVFVSRGAALAAFLAAAGLAGCRRDEVTHARVPKGAMASVGQGAMGQGAPAGAAPAAGDLPAPPRPEGGLRWSLPKGWAESVSGGMRYATLKPATPGKIDVSVVVLPGPAGGELANVNRWRGQIGLSPVDEGALRAARKPLKTKAGELALYDFTSDGDAKTRLVVALAELEGNTWFLKMVGDAGPVATARPDFIRLLESLRRDSKNP
jgi:hypothetical protein